MTFSLNKKRSDYLVGGSQFAIGAFAFVYNLWRTFNPPTRVTGRARPHHPLGR